jgi:hypothetical protein
MKFVLVNDRAARASACGTCTTSPAGRKARCGWSMSSSMGCACRSRAIGAQSCHRAVRRQGSQEIGGVKPARAGIKNRSFRSSGLTSSAHKSPNAARLVQAAEASTWLKTDHHLMSAGAARSAHQMRTGVDVPALSKASALGRIRDLI